MLGPALFTFSLLGAGSAGLGSCTLNSGAFWGLQAGQMRTGQWAGDLSVLSLPSRALNLL